MTYPHVIRLRGPWECEPLTRVDPASSSPLAPGGRGAGGEGEIPSGLPPPGRVNPPADRRDSQGAGFRGLVRYRRRFNRPTNLDPTERVWLVIEQAIGRGQYSLNGQPLGTIGADARSASSDITSLLALRNVLEIDFELPDRTAGHPLTPNPSPARGEGDNALPGDVRLEVRAAK